MLNSTWQTCHFPYSKAEELITTTYLTTTAYTSSTILSSRNFFLSTPLITSAATVSTFVTTVPQALPQTTSSVWLEGINPTVTSISLLDNDLKTASSSSMQLTLSSYTVISTVQSIRSTVTPTLFDKDIKIKPSISIHQTPTQPTTNSTLVQSILSTGTSISLNTVIKIEPSSSMSQTNTIVISLQNIRPTVTPIPFVNESNLLTTLTLITIAVGTFSVGIFAICTVGVLWIKKQQRNK